MRMSIPPSNKAACLFFSSRSGRIFSNKQKNRVHTLDQFLFANSVYLCSQTKTWSDSAEDGIVRERHEDHKQVKQHIADVITAESTEFRALGK